MATVVLPRSLVALFPGAERRAEVDGATVLEVVDALEATMPGVRDRILDAGPTVRRHLNLFVDGERAGLATAVGPASVVHVIPAVSGG
jgi:molybdopterin converting factor small subunit